MLSNHFVFPQTFFPQHIKMMKDWISHSLLRPKRNMVSRKSLLFYDVPRFDVPDDKVEWKVKFPNYKPPFYQEENLKEVPWADPDIGTKGFSPRWNTLDDRRGELLQHDRRHFAQKMDLRGPLPKLKVSYVDYIVNKGYPLNPHGRTGIRGRGNLPCWGPNYTFLVALTRWRRWEKDLRMKEYEIATPVRNPVDKEKTLQVIVVRRKDCAEWGFPEDTLGNVYWALSDNERVSKIVEKIFQNAIDDLHLDAEVPKPAMTLPKYEEALTSFMASGIRVFRGYVDDHRNTDNAWVETVVMHYHDETGRFLDKLNVKNEGLKFWWHDRDLNEMPDAKWMDLTQDIELCASHIEALEKVATHHNLSLFEPLTDRRDLVDHTEFKI